MTDRPRTRWDRVWLVTLPVYWGLLFLATHYPRVRIPGEIPHGDKLIHFAAFGLLAFLFWRALRPQTSRFVLWAGPLLIGYAGLDEWLQQFVGRFTDFNDFIANTAGVVTVLAALELARRWRR